MKAFNQEFFSDERYRGQNVTLKRFGSPRDSSVLFLELPIYAPPFDQDMAAFADSLEARGQEFFHVITENNENLEYLKKCGITSVTIRFATSWDNCLEGPERYREFSWELKPRIILHFLISYPQFCAIMEEAKMYGRSPQTCQFPCKREMN